VETNWQRTPARKDGKINKYTTENLRLRETSYSGCRTVRGRVPIGRIRQKVGPERVMRKIVTQAMLKMQGGPVACVARTGCERVVRWAQPVRQLKSGGDGESI